MTSIRIFDEASRRRAITAIEALDLKRAYRMELKREVKRRTLSQNALYHQWVTIIGQDIGCDHDDMHEALKQKLLPPRFVEIDGEQIEVRRSTAALTTAEMSDYMEKVDRLAASLGIILPHPEDAHLEAAQ